MIDYSTWEVGEYYFEITIRLEDILRYGELDLEKAVSGKRN